MARICDYVQAMFTKANYSGIFTCYHLVLGSIAIQTCNYQAMWNSDLLYSQCYIFCTQSVQLPQIFNAFPLCKYKNNKIKKFCKIIEYHSISYKR